MRRVISLILLLTALLSTELVATSHAATLNSGGTNDIPSTTTVTTPPQPESVPTPTIQDIPPPSSNTPAQPSQLSPSTEAVPTIVPTSPTVISDQPEARTETKDAAPTDHDSASTMLPTLPTASALTDPTPAPPPKAEVQPTAPQATAPPVNKPPLLGSPANIHDALQSMPSRLGNVLLDKKELDIFYAARNYAYAWDTSKPLAGQPSPYASFINSLEQIVEYHGLNHEDYPFDTLRTLSDTSDAAELSKREILTTDTLIKLAHNLHGDRNALDTLYPGWTFHRSPMLIPAMLATAVAANKLEDFFANLIPKTSAYPKLADALKTYRSYATENKAWPLIARGEALRPGDHGNRVAQLRARLIAEHYLAPPAADHAPASAAVYDAEVEKAVIAFQNHHGLNDDGHVGGQTLAALNVPLHVRLDQIIANMERLRHMPEDFPAARSVVINIANMTITIRDGEQASYSGAVVIGRPDRHTPFIQSIINTMIVNPSWHVPTNIAQKDILPKLKENPAYLEEEGIMIRDNPDDPYGTKIDWAHMTAGEFDFRLRQVPGEQNSLGHVKFDFNNPFAVYMHGTPHQELFGKDERAFSSGCIRLESPNDVATILTAHNAEPWSGERLDSAIEDGKTRTIRLAAPIPINVIYSSVYPDQEGNVIFRKDIYDYDAGLAYVMKNHPKDTLHIPLQPTEKQRTALKKRLHP